MAGNTLMSLLVKLGVDSKDLDSGLSTAEGKTNKLGSSISKGIGGAIAGMAAAATVAFGAVSAGLIACIGPASDLSETVSKVGVVFGDEADRVIAFGQGAADALGMSENAALTAAGTYGNLFRAMGMTEDASADMSIGLVTLAGDLASFNNMNPEEVLEKLRAGLTGETEPLKSLGVNINQAMIEAKALELGLWDGKGALDASAKATASYAMIMEQTSLAQGDFERTSGGLANQQRILAANMTNLKASIGTALLPAVLSMITPLNSFASGLTDIMNSSMSTEDKIGAIGDSLGTLVGDLASMLPGIIEAGFKLIQGVVTGIINAIPTLMPAVVQLLLSLVSYIVQMIPVLAQAGITIVLALVTGITQALPTLIPAAVRMIVDLVKIFVTNLPQFIQAGIKLLLALAQGITAAIPILVQNIPMIITTLMTSLQTYLPFLLQAGITLLMALVNGLLTALPILIQYVPVMITGFVNMIITMLPILIQAAFQIIMALFTGLIDNLPAIVQAVIQIVTMILNTIVENLPMIIEGAIALITQLMQSMIDNLPLIITAVVTLVMAILQAVIDNLPLIVEAAVSIITQLVSTLTDNLPQILQMAFLLITELVSGIIQKLPDILTAAGNIVSTLVNGVKGLIPDVLQIGKDLIQGLIDGVGQMWETFKQKIADIIPDLPKWVKDILGIASPSKVFAKMGVQIPKGLLVGFEKSFPSVERGIGRMIGGLGGDAEINATVKGGMKAGAGSVNSGNKYVTLNITNNTPNTDNFLRDYALVKGY